MGKSITDFIIPAALGATGLGLAGAFGTGAAGLGAAEAGASGAGLLGADAAAMGTFGADALATQGATGLLGSAGAEAAGYGGASSLADVASASALPEYAQMADGSWAQTIANDGMTFNPATGGYDGLGGFDRLMQKGGFALDGMTGTDKMNMAQKGLGLMNSQEQPQQGQPKNVQQNIQRAPQSSPASYGSPSSFGANTNQVYPNFGVQDAQARKQEEMRRQFQSQYGQSPMFRG